MIFVIIEITDGGKNGDNIAFAALFTGFKIAAHNAPWCVKITSRHGRKCHNVVGHAVNVTDPETLNLCPAPFFDYCKD